MHNITWLDKKLQASGQPVVIDGGMGTQLQEAGVPMDGQVWSGRAVLTHPTAVRKAHEAYIQSGAEIIIANTFATARHMLEPGGLGDQVKHINTNAVLLAKDARDRSAIKPVAIAGSICEWAPSGAEDSYNKWRSADAISASALEQAEYLAEAGVDIIALEMCMDPIISAAVTEAALSVGLPVWIGVSAKTHRDAQSLSVFDSQKIDFELVVKSLINYPVAMINIMHTPITDVPEAMAVVRKYWQGLVGVYPESGYFTMPNWQFVDVIEPETLVAHAKKWSNDGISLIGGCCGLGPQHISALSTAFQNTD